jgi:hypothetical protein
MGTPANTSVKLHEYKAKLNVQNVLDHKSEYTITGDGSKDAPFYYHDVDSHASITYMLDNIDASGTMTLKNGSLVTFSTEDDSAAKVSGITTAVYESGNNILIPIPNSDNYRVTGVKTNKESYYMMFFFILNTKYYCFKWDPQIIVGGEL